MYNKQNEQKMSKEQLTELQQVLDIIRSAKSEKRKTIKGLQNYIAIYTDASGKDMQFIIR
ncbi:MAG: hypothetical protein IJT03_06860 [Clostridia bacterium]|nr:hypothetical protein [Clostridia bacterium]